MNMLISMSISSQGTMVNLKLSMSFGPSPHSQGRGWSVAFTRKGSTNSVQSASLPGTGSRRAESGLWSFTASVVPRSAVTYQPKFWGSIHTPTAAIIVA